MSSDAPFDSVVQQLCRHRSIRRFQPRPVAEEDIRAAIVCGQRASTSSNIQAYSVLRVKDTQIRQRLVELTGGQSKVAESGAFFVISGDLRRHRLMAREAGEPFELSLEAFVLATIDASLFAQNMCVAFESMGYGICYIGGLRNKLPVVDDLLQVPEGVMPLFGLCVGVPAEDPAAKPRLSVDGVYSDDAFPTDDEVLLHIEEYDARCTRYYVERTGKERDWSTPMARKFMAPLRTDLAEYYRSKGASFH